MPSTIRFFFSSWFLLCLGADAFTSLFPRQHQQRRYHDLSSPLTVFQAAKGVGGGGGAGFGANSNRKSSKVPKNKTAKTGAKKQPSTNKPFVRSEQEEALEQLSRQAAQTCIGRAVTSSASQEQLEDDPFWQLMPSLIQSKFPTVADSQLERIAGFVRHTLDKTLPLEDSIVQDSWRPHDEIHAYMPGLGETKPFHDPDQLELCRQLSANYDTIHAEYLALLKDHEDRFQSVTTMNYKSGWKTLVLFYNGHRIEGFPYHLCPTTTKILETVPLAGRIAGFNRQQPQTGIPLHSDGNNMWLTCQMGVEVPDGTYSWETIEQLQQYNCNKLMQLLTALILVFKHTTQLINVHLF